MSTEIAVVKGTGREGVDLSFTQFGGPAEKGLMMQLKQGSGDIQTSRYIQLTRTDAMAVVVELRDWINNTR